MPMNCCGVRGKKHLRTCCSRKIINFILIIVALLHHTTQMLINFQQQHVPVINSLLKYTNMSHFPNFPSCALWPWLDSSVFLDPHQGHIRRSSDVQINTEFVLWYQALMLNTHFVWSEEVIWCHEFILWLFLLSFKAEWNVNKTGIMRKELFQSRGLRITSRSNPTQFVQSQISGSERSIQTRRTLLALKPLQTLL